MRLRTGYNTLIFLIIVFGSCTERINPDIALKDEENSICDDTILLDDAIKNLEVQLSILYGNNTKALESKRINRSSIQTLKGTDIFPRSKAQSLNITSDLLYLVNFDNAKGFAVLSANKKIDEDIFCITESGEISINDFKDASNIYKIPESSTTITSIVSSLILSEIILNLEYGINSTTGPDIIDNIDDATISKAAPSGTLYGPYCKTKWGQTTIYGTKVWNRYTPNHASAGCVVIATAQILVYRKQANATIFDGIPCSLTGMESVYNYSTLGVAEDTTYYNQAAHFVRELGKYNQCRITYGDNDGDPSDGIAAGAKRALEYYGYVDVDKHTGFGKSNQRIATRVIRNGKPVYLDGLESGLFSGGHAWVLDGECGDYYHINWGWYGMSDGYFKKGTFSTTDRYSVDSIIDTQPSIASASNYTWTYRLVTYDGAVNNNVQ